MKKMTALLCKTDDPNITTLRWCIEDEKTGVREFVLAQPVPTAIDVVPNLKLDSVLSVENHVD